MIDDPGLKAELVYGLDISDLDPHSFEFKQTTILICLCRFFDRFDEWLLPVEHNSLLYAIERQCEATGVEFPSLRLEPQDEGNWRDQLEGQREYRPPRRTRKEAPEMDEVIARQIAEQKLTAYTGLVLRRGPPVCDDKGWRFAVRPFDAPDVPFDGQEMALMVWVEPDDRLVT